MKYLALIAGLVASQGMAQSPNDYPHCPTQWGPPAMDQKLTRIVERDLPDGKKIVVKRSYAITYEAVNGGWLVRGKRLEVTVSAPPVLDMLAAMERNREEGPIWPLMLDKTGTITGNLSGKEMAAPDSKAADAARAILGQSGKQGEAAQKGVGVLVQAAKPSQWPDDLFSAPSGHVEQEQPLPLPDGSQGRIEMVVDVATAGCGTTRLMTRDVVTHMGNSARHSREILALEPLKPPA